jgi:heat shock protein beta
MLKALADRESGVVGDGTDSEDDEESKKAAETAEAAEASKKDGDSSKPYTKFWKDFGVFIRVGVIEDTSNRNRLAKLLRYQSTKTVAEAAEAGKSADDAEYISLQDYVDRMKSGQKSIYFIAGTNRDELARSPLLEELRARNLEVLFFTDPVDEYMVQSYSEFEGHKLQDVSKEKLKLEGDDEDLKDLEASEKELKKEFEPLINWLQTTMGTDRIQSASVSLRVRSSPCVLVSATWGVSANMERIMKAQAMSDAASKFNKARRVLEINPYHPVIIELNKRVQSDPDSEDTKDLALLLYETAAIQSGFSIDDPVKFTSRIHKVINMGLSLDPMATVTDEELNQRRSSTIEEVRRKREEEAQRKAAASSEADDDEEMSLDDHDVHIDEDDAKDEL